MISLQSFESLYDGILCNEETNLVISYYPPLQQQQLQQQQQQQQQRCH